jgi:FHA domain
MRFRIARERRNSRQLATDNPMTESDVESRLIDLMAENLSRVQRLEDVERLAIELGAANGLPADAVAAVAAKIRRQLESQSPDAALVEEAAAGSLSTCEDDVRMDEQRRRQRLTVRDDLPRQRMESAMLVPESGTGPRILIFPRQTVCLGRARENDIVTRFLPRSEENDQQSREISRMHCLIRLTDDGLSITDLDSRRGTALEHLRLNPEQILNRTHVKEDLELDLAAELGAHAFRMTLRLYPESSDVAGQETDDGSYAEALGLGAVPKLWRRAGTAGIDAALLRRRQTLADDEDYLLLFRHALIGSADSSAVQLEGPQMRRRHARLMHLDGCFWIEDLTADDLTFINGIPLPPRTLAPLADGAVLTFGERTVCYSAAAQIGF